MKTTLIMMGCMLLGFSSIGVAQDTLKLDLRSAEQLFISQNYELIAQQYQTEQAKADVITAKLFENPELHYENLFYNQETKKFLETSYATGQYAASISQLIKLAGKRNKNIKLADAGVKMSDEAYYDLMRTLRYDLRSLFYKTYYAQQSAKVYQEQITALEQMLNASNRQYEMGNIALKDLIRIKSLLYNLKGEYSTLMNDIEDQQMQLRLMTRIRANTPLLLSIPSEEQKDEISRQPYTALLDSAMTNRADLKLSRTSLLYAERNLSLQKAMAVPDVELSLNYDLKGNYPDKHTGIGITVPLPLFNRNQGEIKKARVAIQAAQNSLSQQESTLENEVYNSYQSALRTEQLYQSLDQQFNGDFQRLMLEVTKNFKSRNISLIEFLDFYESYKDNTLQMNNLRYERMNAREEINYVTGSAIFK